MVVFFYIATQSRNLFGFITMAKFSNKILDKIITILLIVITVLYLYSILFRPHFLRGKGKEIMPINNQKK